MKKLKSIIALILISSFLLSSGCQKQVYICTGGSAVCYHKKSSCKGLSNCSMEIQKISKEEAAKYRRPCKICY